MNPNKARDFFSAYHEGLLENGLRQSFERLLRSDATVQAEYEHFVKSMQMLEATAAEAIEVPADLHQRISAKLDRHIYETKAAQKPRFGFSLRPLVLGGIAVLALVAATVALWPAADQGLGLASVGPVVSSKAAPARIVLQDGEVHLQFVARGKAKIEVRNALSGEVVRTFALNAQRLDSPLLNDQPEPVSLQIDDGANEPIFIALPGTAAPKGSRGEGPVADYARALAQATRQAVLISVKEPNRLVEWSLPIDQANRDAAREAESMGLSLDVRAPGLLFLSD